MLLSNFTQLRKYSIVDENKLLYRDQRNNLIRIIDAGDEKVDMNYFYKTFQDLEPEIHHIIFIYKTATIQAKKMKIYQHIMKIELFELNELKRLIIGNRFIPKHKKLELEEKEQVSKRFGLNSLPVILQSDPISKLYNFEVGDIIEIERNQGKQYFYRLVISDD